MTNFWQFRRLRMDGSAIDPGVIPDDEQITGELTLYGNIAAKSWWGDEETPKQFAADLNALGNVNQITLRISSNGGDVFAAMAIGNMLQAHPATIVARVEGLAASAASLLCIMADKVEMCPGSYMLVHNPMSGGYGNVNDLQKMTDDLAKLTGGIQQMYVDGTGQPPDVIKRLLDNETWLSAEECVAMGFADNVLDGDPVTAEMTNGQWIINGLAFDLPGLQGPVQMIARQLPPSSVRSRAMAPISSATASTQEPEAPAADTQAPAAPVVMVAADGMTVARLMEAYPQLVAQLRADAHAEGVTAENQRQMELEELIEPGAEAVILAARKDITADIKTVSKQVLVASRERRQGGEYLARRDADAQNGNANAIQPSITANMSAAEAQVAQTRGFWGQVVQVTNSIFGKREGGTDGNAR